MGSSPQAWRRLVLIGAIMMSMTACASAPELTHAAPVTTGPRVAPTAPMTGPSVSASRVFILDSICYGACGYPLIGQPSQIIYDDGSALLTPVGQTTTAGWVDLSWLRQRMTTYLAGGVGAVDPVGVQFSDGGATTVHYVDEAGAITHVSADLLEWSDLDQNLTPENIRSRANLRALLREVDDAVVRGSLWTPNAVHVAATARTSGADTHEWPDIDPSLTAQLLAGATITVTGPDSLKLFAVAPSASQYTRWQINGHVMDVIIVAVLP